MTAIVCYVCPQMLHKKNFSWLLLALLVFLVVIPIAKDLGFISGQVARVVMFPWLLAFGVWSLKGFGKFYYAGIGLAMVGVILGVLSAISPGNDYAMPAFATALGFTIVAVWCIGHHVVIGDEVSGNRLVGAISLYLLLGVVWAITYALVEMLNPGSFVGFSESLNRGWSNEWLYFSFVTMTTLGYGDLAPISATARTIAYLQAVFGQFYIAILVAGLVSAYISERSRD